MKALFFLLVFICLPSCAAEKFCDWSHPGINKYQLDPSQALDDYYLDRQVREELRAKMIHHQYDDFVEIRRDIITGSSGTYSNLRDMHYGRGPYCPGPVHRQQWSETQAERALIYCAGSVCVAVPTVCNNVSLIDRPGEASPIDISPSAGPRSEAPPSGGQDHESSVPTVGDQGSTVEAQALQDSSGLSTSRTGYDGYAGGVGLDCNCKPPPVCPPPVVPPTPAVPEPAEWTLLMFGLVILTWRLQRTQRPLRTLQ